MSVSLIFKNLFGESAIHLDLKTYFGKVLLLERLEMYLPGNTSFTHLFVFPKWQIYAQSLLQFCTNQNTKQQSTNIWRPILGKCLFWNVWKCSPREAREWPWPIPSETCVCKSWSNRTLVQKIISKHTQYPEEACVYIYIYIYILVWACAYPCTEKSEQSQATQSTLHQRLPPLNSFFERFFERLCGS